jgi:hypothetical protein
MPRSIALFSAVAHHSLSSADFIAKHTQDVEAYIRRSRNATPVLLRLSQNVQPERQHAAEPNGVVGVIGAGIAGARVEQDAQTPLSPARPSVSVAHVRTSESASTRPRPVIAKTRSGLTIC